MNRSLVLLCTVLALAPLAALAGTLIVGDSVKLETGFSAPFAEDLGSVTWEYEYDPTYLQLSPDSLAAAADVYENADGAVIKGKYSGLARDGIVAAPVFVAIAATPTVDGVKASTNITIKSVSAVDNAGVPYNVIIDAPEPLAINEAPPRPTVGWLFRWTPVAP